MGAEVTAAVKLKPARSADPLELLPPRFLRRVALVAAPDGHWLWIGATASGMPQFRVGRKVRSAQRVVWELISGVPLRSEDCVVRTCGNKLCVRPSHLALRSAAGAAELGASMTRATAATATINGLTLTLAQWCARLRHVSCRGALSRMQRMGWTAERAVSTPAIPPNSTKVRR